MNYVKNIISIVLLTSLSANLTLAMTDQKEQKSSWFGSWSWWTSKANNNNSKSNLEGKDINTLFILLSRSLPEEKATSQEFAIAINNPGALLINKNFIDNLNNEQKNVIKFICKLYLQDRIVNLNCQLQDQGKNVISLENYTEIYLNSIKEPSVIKDCLNFYNKLDEKQKNELEELILIHSIISKI